MDENTNVQPNQEPQVSPTEASTLPAESVAESEQPVEKKSGDESESIESSVCETCNGRGLIDADNLCSNCGGSGQV